MEVDGGLDGLWDLSSIINSDVKPLVKVDTVRKQKQKISFFFSNSIFSQ